MLDVDQAELDYDNHANGLGITDRTCARAIGGSVIQTIRTQSVSQSCAPDTVNLDDDERPARYYRKINLISWLMAVLIAAICWFMLSRLL